MSNRSTQALTEGEYPVAPELRLAIDAQRTAFAATVGSRYRRRYVITNTMTDRGVANFPYLINLGDTTALTTTKAQADGDDVRVWHNGIEVPRTLKTWDTATSGVWVRIPSLGPLETITFDVMYGNASATGPTTLTVGVDAPAFEMNSSTNAQWVYAVNVLAANAAKGGWRLTSGTFNPEPVFSIPGGWQLAMTRLSEDDRKQRAYTAYVDTNTYYHGIFDSERARAGSIVVDENSGADGVLIDVPIGIESVRCDIRWLNQAAGDDALAAEPIGQFVILTRDREGALWQTLHSSSAIQATEATIATATYTPSAAVGQMAFATWPNDGFNVHPGARDDRKVAARWFTTLELNVDDSKLVQSGGTEVEVYELAEEIRLGGGDDDAGVPPYRSIYIGNAKQTAGAGVPRLAIELDQIVRIDNEKRTMEVWEDDLSAIVESVPFDSYSVVEGDILASGAVQEYHASEWIVLQPNNEPLLNPSFDDDASEWELSSSSSGMTVALTRSTAQFESSPASGLLTINPSTVAINGATAWKPVDNIVIDGLESVQIAASFRVSSLNFVPYLRLVFRDIGGVLTGTSPSSDILAASAINTWYRRSFAALIPETAYYLEPRIYVRDVVGSTTGTVYFDNVSINGNEISLHSVARGGLTLSGLWLPRLAYA